ncbi:hypothetical protein WA026_013542 [Henosepilachna vigintioctopunctata]|uniref:Helicase C-terminal domain-containing protein n=1 Tax=Henosepilachna vigintioctopunctata TaxID=420089 RepID=A0AAW1VGE9_9CUCU
MCEETQPAVIHDDVVRLLLHLHHTKPEGAILCFLPGWEDIRKIRDLIPAERDLNVLCLHSKLQDSEQWRIFSKSPPGVRKIILSTNISETSVTIGDVVYVVDTGIHKETTFDVDKGITCIGNHWVSQSSVEQRKGRAGRVKAGESYHLYPKSKMDSLPKYSLPEILRVSLTKVVLDSKAYCKDSDALEFFSKLPSPPGRENVKLAIDELRDLELIDDEEKLTPLGEVLVDFQLEPKLSKTLVNSVVYKCVTPIVDIVTLFSSGTEMFASVVDRKEIIRTVKSSYSRTSDHLALMRMFEIWDDYMDNGERNKADMFCDDMGLLRSRMYMLKALRSLHFDYLYDGLKSRVLPISNDFSDEDELVKAVLLSGVGSFLTYKNWDVVKGRLKKSNVLLTRMNHKATVTPDSVNFKNTALKSKYLLYINETRSNERRTTLIRETSVISPLMVLLFSSKKLRMRNVKEDQFSPNLQSEEQVIVNLTGTKLNFLLDREQAVAIMKCKLALNSCYEHFVYQLTAGGEHNKELNRLWDELLTTLSDLLHDFKNE